VLDGSKHIPPPGPSGHLKVLATAAAIGALSGCAAGEPMPASMLAAPPPVPAATLNAVYPGNGGLLTGLQPDHSPATSGAGVDPTLIETRRFYDTVQTPFPKPVAVDYPDPFTGKPNPMRNTAPLTLDEWRRVFGFSDRQPAEDTQTYRDRVGTAIYYNRNEIGLGRELGCSRFVDGNDVNGAPIEGVACFVTNHGAGFRQGATALKSAIDGTDVRNTFSITYRPTLDPGYQVQFYVYGPTGRRQDWANLDTLGPRPHPQVCMNCHGGDYDVGRHLAKNARFLPLDPNLVVFAQEDTLPAGLTRAGQEERVRLLNAMTLETPLTPAQRDMVNKLYSGTIGTAGTRATGDAIPDGWTTTEANRDFYRGVVKPYCATCHLAGQRGLNDADRWAYGMFASPAAFDAASLQAYVCNAFSMPNAQPTSLGFWDTEGNPGVTVAGVTFPAGVDAFLARIGKDRKSCFGLSAVSGCDRGSDPNLLCGGPVSGGAICDPALNRCVPMSVVGP
jgi:hypothetical protein